MENLFNQRDCELIIERCRLISPLSEKKWGKMDIHQVVVHLKDLLDIALGNKPASAQGPVLMRTTIGRKLVLYFLRWRKGKEHTPREMNALYNGPLVTDFESDKHLLLIRISEFASGNNFAPHPFFGKMSDKDWGRLAWKHFNHHLLQFGL